MRPSLRMIWNNFTTVMLFLSVLSTLSIEPARAQSPDREQEIQNLKDKLQQMDQMMGEVKAQIKALEQRPSVTVAPAPAQVPAQVVAQKPKDQVVPLESQITEEKNSLDIYGFAMLDSGYDFKQVDPAWFDVVRPTKLPSFTNEFAPSGNVYAGVRQTRFGVKSSTTTPLGDLNTIFEFELFGTGVDAGQTTFRLRHAYGELGSFGAGQTWSPFMDIDVFPNTIEYWGPNGMIFFRNVQLRWMPIRRKRGSVTIAMERPGASADQGLYANRIELSDIKPRFNFPDLLGSERINRDWGHLQIAGIVRKIGWVDTSNNPSISATASSAGEST